jgi:RNA-directed DNA polymerase
LGLMDGTRQMPSKEGLPGQDRGGTPKGSGSVEPPRTSRDTPDPTETRLMEQCVEPKNATAAWKRVVGNKGSPGIDGMSVEEGKEHLRAHWPRIREDLLTGRYSPKPVRRVEIPKPGGGMRQLGIPTVVDRFVQQLTLQVLQPRWDPTFHENSYGFRPGRSAHQAVRQAQAYVQEGRRWCVDVDLEKFFDTVNHDVLMGKVAQRVKDKRMLALIRSFLKAGIMAEGVCMERKEGTPQGGPLSPLLANLLLDEVDWALAERGLAFCRYADDCNIYVRSRRAAERTMETMGKLIGKLKLKINRTKSAVARAWERKFLGYQQWIGPGRVVKLKVSAKALEKFKNEVRSLTGRSCGRSVDQIVKRLGIYLLGWRNYYSLAETPGILANLDKWIRRRLQVIHLKQWKTWEAVYRNLVARGLTQKAAKTIASNRRRYWAITGQAMNAAFPKQYFDELGLPRLAV